MKSMRHPAILTLALVAVCLLAGGCGKTGSSSSSASGVQSSAEKNSFKEVTSKIDAGGNLYAYLSTEQWLDGLSGNISDWRGLVQGLPMGAGEQQNVTRGFDIVTSLVKNSGIEDITGVGMSSIAREPGFYRNTFVLHHYK